MAKNMQPIVKRCRALGISPAAMGYTGKSKQESNRNPGAQRRGKKSEYATQLAEKQKLKFVYGVLEKQFRAYYDKAARSAGNTGEVLLSMLERRLDNVAFRLGLANTRREARQLVSHGHFTVNGQRVDIPSYLVKPGEVISLREKSRSLDKFKTCVENNSTLLIPKWLDFDRNSLEAKVVALPVREDIDLPVEEHLIVELYSK